MRWLLKAKIQKALSLLPSAVSYAAYYRIQRNWGNLRRPDPTPGFEAAIMAWRRIARVGLDARDKVFFEIGTGWSPDAPLAYWLMGARETVTLDLNPYMRPEVIRDSLRHIWKHRAEALAMFGELVDRRRWDELLRFCAGKSPFRQEAFLELCCIRYVAPGDAAATGLGSGCVDFHTSIRVFEHVPEPALRAILREGARLLRPDGLFVYRIDYTDHFSHSDRSISRLHFLRFDDQEWERLAGNRYMYMNRLRHDDFVRLFEESGLRILLNEPDVEQSFLRPAREGAVPLDARFRGKAAETIATTGAWFVSDGCGRVMPQAARRRE